MRRVGRSEYVRVRPEVLRLSRAGYTIVWVYDHLRPSLSLSQFRRYVSRDREVSTAFRSVSSSPASHSVKPTPGRYVEPTDGDVGRLLGRAVS